MNTIQGTIRKIQGERRLDPVAERLRRLGDTVAAGPAGPVLDGRWMGHRLHPALTDLPIGFWTSATVLDLIGGRRSRTAATRLVALGILSAVPTAAAGMVDQNEIDDPEERRVVAAHGAANTVALVAFLQSWRHRRKGHHLRGVIWGLLGGVVASGSAHLGGHLSFGDDRSEDAEAFVVFTETDAVLITTDPAEESGFLADSE